MCHRTGWNNCLLGQMTQRVCCSAVLLALGLSSLVLLLLGRPVQLSRLGSALAALDLRTGRRMAAAANASSLVQLRNSLAGPPGSLTENCRLQQHPKPPITCSWCDVYTAYGLGGAMAAWYSNLQQRSRWVMVSIAVDNAHRGGAVVRSKEAIRGTRAPPGLVWDGDRCRACQGL